MLQSLPKYLKQTREIAHYGKSLISILKEFYATTTDKIFEKNSLKNFLFVRKTGN